MEVIIGILGYGSIGRRHAENAGALGHGILVYDPALNPLDCSSRDEVLARADAIIIATPTPQHWQDIMDCAIREKPMLIEKPITHPDPLAVDQVEEILGRKKVPAFMGFNLRFHECVRKAKEWLPEIGRPVSADFAVLQKCNRPDYLRDGVISNWLSHEIDLALHLLGPGEHFYCEADKADTKADIKIKHPQGTSWLTGDYLTDPEIRRFRISGSHGIMDVDLVRRTVDLATNGVSHYSAEDSFDQNYKNELTSFLNQIEGKPGLCATWQDGVAAERIVIAAREAGGLK